MGIRKINGQVANNSVLKFIIRNQLLEDAILLIFLYEIWDGDPRDNYIDWYEYIEIAEALCIARAVFIDVSNCTYNFINE